jgi:hypothetical protein
MRLTWHIVWKDVMRLRLALALWAVAFLWEYALGVRLLCGSAPDFSLFERLRLYDFVAFGLQGVIGYVLIAALIHEDPLVGSTAFWPTRPISALRLLGAKLIGCLIIFWVFPVLLALPWWVYCGYRAHDVLNASLYTFYLGLLPLVIGLLIASLTATISRYLAGTFVAVAVVCVGFALADNSDFSHVATMNIPAAWEQSDERVRMLIGLVVVGFPIIAAHQFLARKLVRSLVMVACLLVLILLGAAQRPLDLGHFAADTRWPMPAPDRLPVEMQFKEASLEGFSFGTDADFLKGREKQNVRLQANFAVRNIPDGLYASVQAATLAWTWSDGTQVSTRGWAAWQPTLGMPSHPFVKMPSREWWEWVRAHGYMKGPHIAQTYEEYIKVWNHDPGPNFELAFLVSGELAARILSDPPACAVDISGRLLRWQPSPEFMFTPGNGFGIGAQGFRIRKMEWNSDKNWMDTFAVVHEPDFDDLYYPPVGQSSCWFDVINQNRGESAGTTNSTDSIRIATVVVTWAQGSVRAPSRWKAGQWINDTTLTWFDHATVVGGFGIVAGRFETKVNLSKFTFGPEATPSTPPQQN